MCKKGFTTSKCWGFVIKLHDGKGIITVNSINKHIPFLQTLKVWGSAKLPLCPHVPNSHHFSPDSNPFCICYPRPHLPSSIRLPPFSHLLGVFGALSSLHPLTALTPNTHQATTNQANRRVLRHRCGKDSKKHRQRGRDRKRHGA